MLGVIRAVTTVVSNLESIEAAYTTYLGYRFVERGTVPAETAAAWGTTSAAGQPYLIMRPESGEDVFLRFVEDPAMNDYRPLTSYGWNSTEIVVQNTDELNAKLTVSPFHIFGPPRNLDGYPTIRAMQVMGPGSECLYLTDVGPDAGVTLAKAESFVGRVFIVILAGRDIEELRGYFHDVFGMEATPAVPIRNSAINWANHLTDERHPLSLVRLPGMTAIELDEFPPQSGPRDSREGYLPMGMSCVTFEVDKIPDIALAGPPAGALLPPLKGHKTATTWAPGGALIEMVEKLI